MSAGRAEREQHAVDRFHRRDIAAVGIDHVHFVRRLPPARRDAIAFLALDAIDAAADLVGIDAGNAVVKNDLLVAGNIEDVGQPGFVLLATELLRNRGLDHDVRIVGPHDVAIFDAGDRRRGHFLGGDLIVDDEAFVGLGRQEGEVGAVGRNRHVIDRGKLAVGVERGRPGDGAGGRLGRGQTGLGERCRNKRHPKAGKQVPTRNIADLH